VTVTVACRHCPWQSDPLDDQRETIPIGVGIMIQRSATPMQQAIGVHVAEAHLPLTHAWIEGRDWEIREP
jgi:hypothetical protein